VLQHALQRLFAARGLDQILAQSFQHRLERLQVRDLVIDQQNIRNVHRPHHDLLDLIFWSKVAEALSTRASALQRTRR
jgi:hypothetical protein